MKHRDGFFAKWWRQLTRVSWLEQTVDLRKFIFALSIITVQKLSGNKTVLLQKTDLDALVIDNVAKL